jgi:hypothetical protein
MKVCSFLGGIPASNKNPDKPEMLKLFAKGVNISGDQGVIITEQRYEDCDVAVIQGFVHEEGKHAPHLAFRKKVFDINTQKPKRCVIIDSNMFSFATGKDHNNTSLLRFSFDGIFPNTGDYCNHNIETDEHWQRINKKYNLTIKPYRQNGDHILICLQRDGGWSMRGQSVMEWLDNTIKTIRQYSNRRIVIRCHPGTRMQLYQGKNIAQSYGVSVSNTDQTSLTQDLQNCWAMVVKNSSPTVAAVVNGIPIFVTDPAHCQAGSIANLNLENIENPIMPERELFLWKLAACHWDFDELANGSCWKHMRQYV